MKKSIEEMNRDRYQANESKDRCGYWDVCSDHACGCSPSAIVSQGFNNEVYEEMKAALQKEAELFYDDF